MLPYYSNSILEVIINVAIELSTPENLYIVLHRAIGREKFNLDGRRRRRRKKVAVIDLTATPQIKSGKFTRFRRSGVSKQKENRLIDLRWGS